MYISFFFLKKKKKKVPRYAVRGEKIEKEIERERKREKESVREIEIISEKVQIKLFRCLLMLNIDVTHVLNSSKIAPLEGVVSIF